jgi:hypothetical protein
MTAAVSTTADGHLAKLFAERAAWVGGDPVRPAQMTDDDRTVLVVMCRFDLVDFVTGVRAFTAGLDADEADRWRRSWTATRFLFGNPANLTGRTPARVMAANGGSAWLGPYPPTHLPGLARLLKPVTGTLPDLPPTLSVPGQGPPRLLYVATNGLSIVDYLVHLHHTLAEAVLGGRLGANDAVRLHHRPDIDAAVAAGEPDYARVHHPDRDTARLRLFTWLAPRPQETP